APPPEGGSVGSGVPSSPAVVVVSSPVPGSPVVVGASSPSPPHAATTMASTARSASNLVLVISDFPPCAGANVRRRRGRYHRNPKSGAETGNLPGAENPGFPTGDRLPSSG